MSEVFDEVMSRLKQKAKTTNWIYETYFRTEDLHALTEWVRLEDVKEAINQLTQKYVLIPKEKLKSILIKVHNHPEEVLCLSKIFEELLE